MHANRVQLARLTSVQIKRYRCCQKSDYASRSHATAVPHHSRAHNYNGSNARAYHCLINRDGGGKTGDVIEQSLDPKIQLNAGARVRRSSVYTAQSC